MRRLFGSVVRRIGRARTAPLGLTGQPISADQAPWHGDWSTRSGRWARAMTTPSLLLRNVATGTGSRREVRLDSGLIAEIGVGLVRRGDAVVDGAGGMVIVEPARPACAPACRGHRPAVRGLVRGRGSGRAGPADRQGGGHRRSGDWLRALPGASTRAGPLDRSRSWTRSPVRSRPGSASQRGDVGAELCGAACVGADGCELAGIERDSDGVPTVEAAADGRLAARPADRRNARRRQPQVRGRARRAG